MLQFIQEHYAEDVSVEQIAASAAISPSECLRCFHDMIGTTPNQYLRDQRTQRAAELLCGTGLQVSEIAAQCGFRDASYFARAFRQVYGCGPTDYRRKARESGSGVAGKSPQAGFAAGGALDLAHCRYYQYKNTAVNFP